MQAATALKSVEHIDPKAPAPRAAARILVADDDRDMCELAEAALRERGYDVVSRLTPGEALAELDHEDYSALLVDIQMEGKSGLDLCREAIAKRPDLPVIVMTG